MQNIKVISKESDFPQRDAIDMGCLSTVSRQLDERCNHYLAGRHHLSENCLVFMLNLVYQGAKISDKNNPYLGEEDSNIRAPVCVI